MKYVASVSFGKDSLAMLFKIMEKGLPLHEVVFYDTGMEFQAIYDTRDKVLPILAKKGIEYVELQPKTPFLEKMLHLEVKSRKGGTHRGYSWCGGSCRWGTSDKLRAIKKHIGNNYDYVGIAADEVNRIEKEKRPNRILFLADNGITEREALEYCYDLGFYWLENGVRLYDMLDRVSCWCCANKNNKELINIFHHLPEYWEKPKRLQRLNRLQFRVGKMSIFDIEHKIMSGKLKYKGTTI